MAIGNNKVILCILLVVLADRLYVSYKNSQTDTQATLNSSRVESHQAKKGGSTVQPQIPLDILTDERGQNISCPEGTLLVLNYHGDDGSRMNHTTTTTYKIPLVIHQSYATRCVTKEFYELTQIWKSFGIPYYFHDDAAMDRLVFSGRYPEFPHLPLVWENCITKPVVKSDMWRLLLLYEYGGIYADMDAKPISFSPTTTLLPEDEMYAIAESSFLPSFHFLASMPRHPLPFLTLQEQLYQVLFVMDTGVYNPAKKTGKVDCDTWRAYTALSIERTISKSNSSIPTPTLSYPQVLEQSRQP
jgi:mannosyltransferase OCH1-like enzyme